MLKKENRLSKQKQFLQFKATKAYFGTLVNLKTRKTDDKKKKFGFIISTKISQKATQRNRLKRCLRELIRENLRKIKPGYYLIIGRSQILNQKRCLIKKDLVELFKKSKSLYD